MVTLLALLQPEYSFTLLPPTVQNFASLIQHRQRCRNQHTRPRGDCTVPPVWYSWMHCLQNPFEKQKTTGADHSSAPTKSKCPPAQTTTPDCLLQHGIGTQNAKAAHRLVRRSVESYLPTKSATILAPNAGAPFITNRFSRAFIFTHFRINGK